MISSLKEKYSFRGSWLSLDSWVVVFVFFSLQRCYFCSVCPHSLHPSLSAISDVRALTFSSQHWHLHNFVAFRCQDFPFEKQFLKSSMWLHRSSVSVKKVVCLTPRDGFLSVWLLTASARWWVWI